MKRKQTYIMLVVTAAIFTIIGVIDIFANTFISNILPYIVIVATIITVIELIITVRVIKNEYKES